MAKKISTDNLARLIENVALRPYELLESSVGAEERWMILTSTIKGLSKVVSEDVTVESSRFPSARFNISALAKMERATLIHFFTTPSDLYHKIHHMLFEGIREYVEKSEIFNNVYSVKDIED